MLECLKPGTLITKAYIVVIITETRVPRTVTITDVLYAKITILRRWDSINRNVFSVKFLGQRENPFSVMLASSEKAEENARSRGYRHIREKKITKI